MIRSVAVAGLCLYAVSASAVESSAMDYLREMNNALQTLNYRGTVVYYSGGTAESMEVFHKSGPNGEQERLIHLSGEPREVLRSNDVVTCYIPEIRSVLVGKRSLGASFLNRMNIDHAANLSFYEVKQGGEGRVAGKHVRLIRILPRDQFRYGYRLWLEKDNSLLLKSELLDTQGKTLEQFMFAQIAVVNNIPDAMLKTSINSKSFTWHRAQANSASGKANRYDWQLNNLPAGFMVIESGHRDIPNSQHGADHLVVSDGLASVSIYIEDFGVESQSLLGATQFGALNVYGKVLGDHKLTVVGDVPATTVKMIADSVAAPEGG